MILYIFDYVGFLQINTFARYCASVGLWDVFRRSSSIYMRIIDEHNWKYNTIKSNNCDVDDILD